MEGFRIAIGRASCANYSGNDQNILEVCKLVSEKLTYLRSLQYSQLEKWMELTSETVQISEKEVVMTVFSQKNEKAKLLVVVQAFYPTLKFPNYFSFSFVGKLYAEGFVVEPTGSIRDATDGDLWDFR